MDLTTFSDHGNVIKYIEENGILRGEKCPKLFAVKAVHTVMSKKKLTVRDAWQVPEI